MLPETPLNEDQRKEIERRTHRSACFQRVFKGVDGELTLKEIDIWTGYKNDTFDPDPYKSAYKAGVRAASIFIHNVIELDIEEVTKLLEKEKETK